MKRELTKHFLPLTIFFIITSIVWLFNQTVWYQHVYLFFGLLWGAFFIDIDHLFYWYYLAPNLEESRLARIAITKKDYRSVLKLLESTHKFHTNLVFHHYLFQIILSALSLFAFTSTNNVFGLGFLLALNVHLLVDQIDDYRADPHHLQTWLFARSQKQITLSGLKKYLYFFVFLTTIFGLLLIKSKT